MGTMLEEKEVQSPQGGGTIKYVIFELEKCTRELDPMTESKAAPLQGGSPKQKTNSRSLQSIK